MEESTTRRLLRARDAMDRDYAQPLDVAALARIALLSPSHFTRRFKATFGETPHQYLYRRRIERAKWLLRGSDLTVTDICFEVGYTSIGTFTRTFVRLVGETPGRHRARGPLPPAPGCIVRAWTRNSRFGEARSEPDP
jgi:AraC-like DNA-binding protein